MIFAGLLLFHHIATSFCKEKRAFEIDICDEIPIRFGEFHRRVADIDTGIVDKDMSSASQSLLQSAQQVRQFL